jgi:hypothetical protein
MQEVRNSLFPGRNVFIADSLFGRIVFAVVLTGGLLDSPPDEQGFFFELPRSLFAAAHIGRGGMGTAWRTVSPCSVVSWSAPRATGRHMPLAFEFVFGFFWRICDRRLGFFCRRVRFGTGRVIPIVVRRGRRRGGCGAGCRPGC